MMKKSLVVLTVLIICLVLCACGGNNSPATGTAPAASPVVSEPTSPVVVETAPTEKQPSVIGDSTSGTVVTTGDSWRNNIMSRSGLDSFNVDRKKILTVTFLDSTAYAPATVWYLGEGATENVLGWIEYQDNYYHLYIAADGGVNGKLCTDHLFLDCPNLYQVVFNGAFHTEEATSMKNMFCDCRNLMSVDINTLDSSNVQDMKNMFYGCIALKELDLSNFDTSKVTDMSYMFYGCKQLETVDTSSFDTANVTDMSNMFCDCDALTTVYLNDWDFSNVTKYKYFMGEDVTINGQPWEALFH